MKKSILFILPDLNAGGAERIVTTIANHLPREKFSPSILLLRKEGFYLDFLQNDVEIIEENIEVIENIIPYRREGSFDCLSHFDEGFKNGKWVKGETTARNEKRFVSEMQQNKVKYKEDGISNLKYEFKSLLSRG